MKVRLLKIKNDWEFREIGNFVTLIVPKCSSKNSWFKLSGKLNVPSKYRILKGCIQKKRKY